MSINGFFRQISPRALDLVLANPELVSGAMEWESSDPGNPDPLAGVPSVARDMIRMLPEEARAGAIAEMGAMLAMYPGMEDVYAEERAALRAGGASDDDFPPPLHIYKSWEPINFLLAGNPHEPGPGPLESAILGGREIGEDLGYGPPRVFSAAETAGVAAALESLGEAGLMARYDAEAFEAAGLCPEGWTDPDEDEERREWMLNTFQEVRDYYVDARRRGYAMVLALI